MIIVSNHDRIGAREIWQRLLCFGLVFAAFGFAGCAPPSSTTAEAKSTKGNSRPAGPREGTHIGDKALEVSGTTTDKQGVNLTDFRGKVVLVDFWATWCRPCLGMIPHEKELVARFKDRPFVILGVCEDDPTWLFEKMKLPWPNIFDANGVNMRRWKVAGFPLFILIDEDGFIIDRWEGGGNGREMEVAIAQAVKDAEKNQ